MTKKQGHKWYASDLVDRLKELTKNNVIHNGVKIQRAVNKNV